MKRNKSMRNGSVVPDGAVSECEIFVISARRCKRCGGLLTSAKSIADGYGHACKMKARRETTEREAVKDQISLFDERQAENQYSTEETEEIARK